MEKETIGTIISVTKQWWLKVNRKSVRIHAMDGADFPYIIKIKYTIEGKDYICRKCIGAGKKIPDKGATIKVIYCEVSKEFGCNRNTYNPYQESDTKKI